MKADFVKQARQGDVLMVKMDIPASAKAVKQENGLATLAYGEATGHHHSFHEKARLFRDDGAGGALYVRAAAGAVLTHQEHMEIHTPAGDIRKVTQKEYSPQALRNVAD
jgi:hypothetical protein